MEQDPVSKQNTQRAKGYTRCRDPTCSRKEVISIFVEWHSHDPVSEVEGFLNPITMVDIDINVEHPRVVPSVMIKPWSGEEVNPHLLLPNTSWEYLGSASGQVTWNPHPTKFPPESPGQRQGRTETKGTDKWAGSRDKLWCWRSHLRKASQMWEAVRVGPRPRDLQVSKVSTLLLEHLLEQLQDANYNVIDIAEAGSLWEMDL